MKKLLIALFGAALVLGACGAADEPAPAPEETPEEAPEETPADDATDETAEAVTFDATEAQESYQSCAGCHGGDLQGGGAYASPITGLSYEQVLAAIEQGPGTMPANAGGVTGQEAENLAAWIAAQ